ncbi:ATP-binding protein [Virgibacillus kekensis]|uniref:ATP-binding protein n=1 Tax=Virgibacillus kekensis TaxID=202261 RepID=A0ABV9DI82_9BACI
MKTFLSKILPGSSEKVEEKVVEYHPKLTHISSYQMVEDRALTGWVASRLAHAMGFDEKDREALFFLAFTARSLDDMENESIKELMIIAQSAVKWIRTNSVIEEELNQVSSTVTSKEILSRVLNDIQSDVNHLNVSSNETDKKWEVYRDVIYAATHGQFLLIKKCEIARYTKGKVLCEADIAERNDIAKARNMAKECLTAHGLKSTKITSYNLIISEAVTNLLKHATGGKMTVYKEDNLVCVLVEDKGPGFPLKILPKTTLMAGFSTKESLGQGFTLMMKMANQVVLETSSSGSTLILVLNAGEEGI